MPDNAPARWPAGPGEMARRIREHDWSATPLGPPQAWPQSLRTAVELMLASGFPSAIHYGPEALLLYNDRWSELAGERHPWALGRSSLESFAESRSVFEPHLEQARRGLTLTLGDQGFPILREGTLQQLWFTLSYSPLRAEDGRVAGVFVVAVETTARHRAETALYVSEERLQAALVAGRMAHWHWYPESDEMVASDTMDDLFGLPPGESFESSAQGFALVHPADVEAHRARVEEALREGHGWHGEYRIVRPRDGRVAWLEERTHPVRNPVTGELEMTGLVWDVTERKQAEQALRASQEQHRLIVESARDFAILMLDPEGRVSTWNPGAERIFGYAADEIVGRDGALLFTPEDRAAGEHDKELETAAARDRASDDRWQQRKDGTRFWASGVTMAMWDEGGRLRGFTKVLRDLTGAKRLEEQRERLLEQERLARAEAERAMVMKDEFLAVVSHELRTPLSAILLWAKLLRSGRVPEARQAQALETIESSATAQQQLIEDLLDVSRMVSGKLRLEVRDAELEPVVRAAVEAVRPMAEAKGVALEIALDAHDGWLRVDPDRVQQVVWNLLSNAVKFTDRGGRVTVRYTREAGAVRLTVTDTGRGIDPAFLPHVFERFRQADASATRSVGGLGLGLAIVRQLVELHGGTVRADSPGLGRGATFTVELPAGEGVAAGAAGAPQRPGPPALFDGARVLLVEDEPGMREAVRWVLEGSGAEVTAVASAAEALAAFQASRKGRRFDALLSDVGLPGQDGYALLRELRALEHGEPPLPAAALTAYAREEDRARATAAGYQAHVPKPVEPDVLVRTVAELLGRGVARAG